MDEIKIPTILDLLKNNEDAYGLELLYKYHYKLLFSTVFSVCKNEEDSKDIVQNVLFKLSKMPKDKFPKKGAISWIYRVIKNEAIDYIKNQKTHIDIDSISEIPIVDREISDLFDMENYYSLIESLNEKQKEVVTLKVLGELSHKDIARLLDKPIGTIQWIYNTSIKQLRVALASMMSFLMVIIGGIAYRIHSIFNPVKEDPGDFNISSAVCSSDDIMPSVSTLFTDEFFIYLTIAFLVISIGTIVFYKNTDKLPTKQKK